MVNLDIIVSVSVSVSVIVNVTRRVGGSSMASRRRQPFVSHRPKKTILHRNALHRRRRRRRRSLLLLLLLLLFLFASATALRG